VSTKIKLHYVRAGELVEFTYIIALAIEIKDRGGNPMTMLASFDIETLRRWVDWLLEQAPEDFYLKE